jgi:Protein of unknown function (DUF3617)
MRKPILLAACAAVAACNKGPEVHEENASVAEVAQQVRATSGGQGFIRPGLWESKVTIQQFDMPGMPAEVALRMKAAMAEHQPDAFKTCLTQKDVKRPKEEFFAGKNNQCRYEHFDMGGGKIDALMHCGEERMTQTMQMNGTYSPDSYQMQMSSKMQSKTEANTSMAMRMRIDAHRVGECTGKQG